jgi:DNA-binding response OmpR family regulator
MAKRILVVDDDLPVVRLLRTVLEQEGFRVASAANGAECLIAIESQPPDLVILDVMMPVMDGFQTLRVLREKPEGRNLPVILLTAKKEDADVTKGWATGADLYLTKPIETNQLVIAVKRILAAESSQGHPQHGGGQAAG